MGNEEGWARCREALADEVTRVTGLLRSLPRGLGGPAGTPVLGDWDALEVAVHLSQTWIAIPALARGDMTEVDAVLPDRDPGPSLIHRVEDLGGLTRRVLATEPERDPAVLAERIEDRARDYLARCSHQDPGEFRDWLVTGVQAPPSVFSAHLLGEMVVHGWDIARAAGRPWRINPAHAALVVRWFLLDVLGHGGGALITDPAARASVTGRYRIHIRGHQTVQLHFDEFGAHWDEPPGRPDCRLSVDPVAFLLMFFGRRSLLGTMARGGVLAWGRKPWLAVRLQTAVPTP